MQHAHASWPAQTVVCKEPLRTVLGISRKVRMTTVIFTVCRVVANKNAEHGRHKRGNSTKP
jgi:hypothetical protein